MEKRNTGIALSIIVPCHNVCGKIDRLEKSLKEIKNSSIELILVEDNSSDGTERRLQELAARLKIPTTVKCGLYFGPGGPRNEGIRISSGRYIWLIDADDDINAGPVLSLIDELRTSNIDIYGFDVQEYESLKGGVSHSIFLDANDLRSRMRVFGRVAGKIIRSDFLMQNNIDYMPFAFSSDNLFAMKICSKYETYKSFNAVIYRVLPAPNSITRSGFNPKYLSRWLVIREMVDYARVNSLGAAELRMMYEDFYDLGMGRTWAYYLTHKKYLELLGILPELMLALKAMGIEDYGRKFYGNGSILNRIAKKVILRMVMPKGPISLGFRRIEELSGYSDYILRVSDESHAAKVTAPTVCG